MNALFELLSLLGKLPKQFREMIVFGVMCLLLLLMTLPASAQTYNTPDYTTNIVLPTIISATGNSNVTSGTLASQPVVINPGFGIGLSYKFIQGISGSTTNVGFYIGVTPDGSNWLSPPPYYFELKHVAGTTNWVGTNMPASWFDGFMKMRAESVTNCDNGNSITNVGLILSRKRLDYQ